MKFIDSLLKFEERVSQWWQILQKDNEETVVVNLFNF